MCNFFKCNVHRINILCRFDKPYFTQVLLKKKKKIVGYWCYSVLSVEFSEATNYFLQNMICMFHINAPYLNNFILALTIPTRLIFCLLSYIILPLLSQNSKSNRYG